MIEKRLFVALELSDAVTAALAAVQPAPVEGMRLLPQSELHLTLHFRGSADITEVVSALRAVAVPRFSLAIKGVGRFSPDGDFPLWARVASSPELVRLHQAVGAALTSGQWRVESRPFVPHVTLAWCTRAIPAAVIDGFLTRGAELVVEPVAVDGFTLFSGTTGPGYSVVRRFPLR